MEKHVKEKRLLEIRALDNQNEDFSKMTIEGYAVEFDKPATHYGYTEVIDKDAFNGCDMRDVCCKYNHEDSFLLMARTRNGSLRLIVDDIGLKISADLIDTTTNRDIYKCIQAGLIDKMSFCFTCDKEEYDYETDTRRVLSIDKLYDVSVVDVPFYDSTEVFARSKEDYHKEKEARDLELAKAKILAKIGLRG